MKEHGLILDVPGGAKRVLLHTCCAPCSSAIIEIMLQQGITPTVFYSNSNIFPLEEYLHRKDECTRYAQSLGLEIVDDDYGHEDWRSCAAQGLENEPERGARCLACFKYRLLRAARYASAHGYTVLTTTLASSRWKDLAQVDEAGRWACSQVENVTWWGQNWRKGGLQDRRNQLIRELNFYNQQYCGCEYSLRDKK
ncbi:MAG: epoxyqueuosine reductase QueH [Bacteroidales bacterium]|nr:epoxyqueuosine reductase QueH [Bacteroidales bacterium]